MSGLTEFAEAAQAIALQRKRNRLWEFIPTADRSTMINTLAELIHLLNEDQLDKVIARWAPTETWEGPGPFKRDPETGEYCYPERAAAASSCTSPS